MSENINHERWVVSAETIAETCGDADVPAMGTVEQRWETDPIPTEEVGDRASAAVAALDFAPVPPGGEVAVGVGSRGIADLPAVVSGVVSAVRERGYDPFVFPAMGSHGGATAEGQRETLHALGVDEASAGCEIRATMDTVEVGVTASGVTVVADANAAAADGILPVNRVKPHTDFQGRVESGLSKMLVIGMGKQRGAKAAHEAAVDRSFRNVIPEVASVHLAQLPVVGGVALVEDQRDDTAVVEGVPPSGFLDREAELLETAYALLPTLPFDELDVLVVDRMGKDVSGAGMDTNVVGRLVFGLDEPGPESPNVKRIFARALTGPSHGNAIGVGSADFVHRDLLDDADVSTMAVNALTASTPRACRLPVPVETDRAGLVAALSTVGEVDPADARVVRITDTMRLGRVHASSALVAEARGRDDLGVVSDPTPPTFDGGDFTAPSPVDPDG